MKQYATLEDTLYFWFGSNNTSGSGDDGASAVYDVRLAGGGAADAPILSGSATLLSHANYPAGCYEIAIAATTGNGFAANNTYAVFCTLLVDSQNPTGFVGCFDLKAIKTLLTGDPYAIVNHEDYGNAQLARTGADSDTLETLSDEIDGVVTDIGNLVVPDAAGTAAGLIAALNDFDPAADTVVNVTNVAVCASNSDMRGTDGANTVVPDAAGTAAGLIAALNDLSSADAQAACDAAISANTDISDILTDTETTIPNQISGLVVPDVAGTAAGLIGALNDVSSADVQSACDTAISANTDIGNIDTATGTTIPNAIAALNDISTSDVNTQCTNALNSYDPPTQAEMNARSLPTASYGTAANQSTIIADITALHDISVADIIAGISEGTLDLQEILRIILAATAGKSAGGGTNTITFRDQADTKNRISATVDANNNRTAITVNGS